MKQSLSQLLVKSLVTKNEVNKLQINRIMPSFQINAVECGGIDMIMTASATYLQKFNELEQS